MGLIGMTLRARGSFRLIQILVCIACCLRPAAAGAQDHEHHEAQPPAAANGAWTWSTDANLIFGYNYQARLFADFWAWESQNWVMGSGHRQIGDGRFSIQGMLSMEP